MKKKLKDMTLVEFREFCIYAWGNACNGCPFRSSHDGILYEAYEDAGYCALYEPVGIDEGVFEIEVEIPDEEEDEEDGEEDEEED